MLIPPHPPDPHVFEQYAPGTSYGPECYLMPATGLGATDCTVEPLCASGASEDTDAILGTSYSVPQVFGLVMQVANVMALNGQEFDADKIVNFLNQGCTVPEKGQAYAKCTPGSKTINSWLPTSLFMLILDFETWCPDRTIKFLIILSKL